MPRFRSTFCYHYTRTFYVDTLLRLRCCLFTLLTHSPHLRVTRLLPLPRYMSHRCVTSLPHTGGLVVRLRVYTRSRIPRSPTDSRSTRCSGDRVAVCSLFVVATTDVVRCSVTFLTYVPGRSCGSACVNFTFIHPRRSTLSRFRLRYHYVTFCCCVHDT